MFPVFLLKQALLLGLSSALKRQLVTPVSLQYLQILLVGRAHCSNQVNTPQMQTISSVIDILLKYRSFRW